MDTVVTKKRVPEIDILRGIAAILMILGHSFIVYPIDISDIPWCAAVGHFIYTFHMELFFVLAGVVYHCANYGIFIKKKVKRILIPYFFFGVISLLLHAFGGAAINGVEPIGEGIRKMLFHGGNYWFLYVLFLIFAVYPWIEKIIKNRKILFALAVLLVVLDDIIQLPNLFSFATVVYYLPYFIFGRYVSEIIGGLWKRRDRAISAVLALLLYMILDRAETSGIMEVGVTLNYVRAIAIIVFLYVIVLELHPYWNKNKAMHGLYVFLTDSGRFSLQLYLFNGYLLTIIRIIICQILHITSPALIVLAIWSGNMVATLIVCKWIIPRIPILRELCGVSKQ